MKLRWFFKEALRDLLPEQIINKTKHGFGLPFGPWSVSHGPLRELVGDSLSALTRRGWVRKTYLDQHSAPSAEYSCQLLRHHDLGRDDTGAVAGGPRALNQLIARIFL